MRGISMKGNDGKFEEEILDSFEKGEWQSVPDLKDEIARYALSAGATLAKDKRINIRLSHPEK
jgi:predicted DNA binding CopG/RHH family protein